MLGYGLYNSLFLIKLSWKILMQTLSTLALIGYAASNLPSAGGSVDFPRTSNITEIPESQKTLNQNRQLASNVCRFNYFARDLRVVDSNNETASPFRLQVAAGARINSPVSNKFVKVAGEIFEGLIAEKGIEILEEDFRAELCTAGRIERDPSFDIVFESRRPPTYAAIAGDQAAEQGFELTEEYGDRINNNEEIKDAFDKRRKKMLIVVPIAVSAALGVMALAVWADNKARSTSY